MNRPYSTTAALEILLRRNLHARKCYFCNALATLRFTHCPCPLPPNLWASLVWCLLAQGLSLICGFCPSARTFALRLPPHGRSPFRTCLRLVLLLVSIVMNTFRFSYRGLSPHKFTPMPGVHQSVNPLNGLRPLGASK
jgi:hypothetical protein